MILRCVAGLACLVGVAALLAIERRLAAGAARRFARAYLGSLFAASSALPADGRRSEISSLRRPIPQMKAMESHVGREGPWP